MLTEAKSHTGLCNINKEVSAGNHILGPFVGTMGDNWQCYHR